MSNNSVSHSKIELCISFNVLHTGQDPTDDLLDGLIPIIKDKLSKLPNLSVTIYNISTNETKDIDNLLNQLKTE